MILKYNRQVKLKQQILNKVREWLFYFVDTGANVLYTQIPME